MIPYDELVVALQTWRAKKGLPIGGPAEPMKGSVAPIVAPPPAAPPPRAAPATPPPPRTVKPMAEPPAHETLDAASLLDDDEAYASNEGDDFSMPFAGAGASGGGKTLDQELESESTSIGSPPMRPSDLATDPHTDALPRPGKRTNSDW